MQEDEFARRLRGLPLRFAGRLDSEALASVSRYAIAGEWVLTLDHLLACLADQGVPITPAERDEIAQLLTELQEPLDGYFDGVRIEE